ncbi:MAG: DNA polymerase III subunit alpha [Bacilli bacterium]|nr:DNA polymerase III subunit alpha [Bacilli bacterium]
MNYTPLRVKTSYSILSSLNNIQKLVSLAKEYGYKSLAITDEFNMFGVMEFYLECKKNNIKPIIGIELTISNTILLLYAKNINGYKNLIKLATIKSDRDLTYEDLTNYKDNLILVMPYSNYDESIYNIYIDKYIGYTTKEERDKIKDKKVLINDIKYLSEKDSTYLDYLEMIKEGKILGEYELNTHKFNHLLTMEEVSSISSEIDIENTNIIANSCNVELTYTNGLLPIYDENIDSKKFLYELSHKGLKRRLNDNVPDEYLERLDMELKVIDEMGFNDYFLIVYDYVLYSKKNNILVGPGRGSAAGSLVSYTLGITDIDPIKYNLLFERFLNKERITMPDIDIDFDANKRMEVIDYVTKKYGEKKVVGIITFNTLGAKQVIRDVGRVLNISQRLIDTIAKMCTKDLNSSYNENKNLQKLIDNSYELKKLYDISLNLEGLPRHISVHAAGVVMSNIDIDETIPLYKNQLGMYVTGYSKDYLEPLGLLKMDFLGISNLTMLDEVINNIKETEKINITFNNIPLDDKKTIELFKNGDTDGIFQFESPGMIKFLRKLKANSLNDIYAALSLYRPGPMDSIDDYIKRKEGKVKIDYIHKDLEPILKETYGIIVYQEQIMQISSIIAGYSLGEADILRRAMSKKKEDILLKEKEKFVEKSLERGYDIDTINKVYDRILKFANYGFNKSHAVAYSIISYKMAFLKAHFYPYFMVSLLTSQINNEIKTNTYIAKLRQKNIKVILPNINVSVNKYITKNNEIICPLSIIRNVGTNVTNMILKEREKGEFKDFIDFVLRMNSQSINKKVITSLILSGSFDTFGYNKNTLINNLDNVLNYVDLAKDSGLIKIEPPVIDELPEYTKEELVKNELNTFGFYLSYHPVSKYKENNFINTLSLEEYTNKYIELVLEVNNIKEILTKKNDVMAFIKASDEYKQIDLTLFPKTYEENKNLEIYDIIKIYGKVEKRFDNYQIIVSKIINLTRSKYEK